MTKEKAIREKILSELTKEKAKLLNMKGFRQVLLRFRDKPLVEIPLGGRNFIEDMGCHSVSEILQVSDETIACQELTVSSLMTKYAMAKYAKKF